MKKGKRTALLLLLILMMPLLSEMKKLTPQSARTRMTI